MFATRRVYREPVARRKTAPKAASSSEGVNLISKNDRTRYEEEQVMYWRKANHIHGWFVDNVQGGVDDCGTYEVTPDQLRQLLAICECVIEHSELVDGVVYAGTQDGPRHPKPIDMFEKGQVIRDAACAEQLLPRVDGFFFGSKQYDESYLNDVVETRDWLTAMLADHDAGHPGVIFYSSSW